MAGFCCGPSGRVPMAPSDAHASLNSRRQTRRRWWRQLQKLPVLTRCRGRNIQRATTKEKHKIHEIRVHPYKIAAKTAVLPRLPRFAPSLPRFLMLHKSLIYKLKNFAPVCPGRKQRVVEFWGRATAHILPLQTPRRMTGRLANAPAWPIFWRAVAPRLCKDRCRSLAVSWKCAPTF